MTSDLTPSPTHLCRQIFFSFMITPLFKKPKFASTVGSLLTVVFGCLSLFTILIKDFPQPLVWLLCLLSPSALSIGIAQVRSAPPPGRGNLPTGVNVCLCVRL